MDCGARLQRRYQFQSWTARSVYSYFRGLVKRGGIGIGLRRLLQDLDGCSCATVGPIADKDDGA